MQIEIKLKRLHPAQQHIKETAKRFNVLKCGRRFGKTSMSQELLLDPALDGFPVAYYAPTYKDLATYWDEFKILVKDIIAQKSEQLKKITLITGGVIDFWSLEEPDSGRGLKYKRVIIDECEKAGKLEEAWKGTIRALLTDFRGDCYFLSTPKFGDTFFKKLYNEEEKFPDIWKSWTFTTYDNPHISREELEEVKETLDYLYFRCEYLAEDVEIGGMLWAFAFEREKHVSKSEIQLKTSELTYLSFDFNRNPITCSVIQHYNDTVYVVEQIKLADSDIYKMCMYIKSKYNGVLFIITGDATGRNSTAMVGDKFNYYKIIKKELNLSDAMIKVPSVNPVIKENSVLVNSILSRYNVQICPIKGKGLIYDLANVRTNSDGTIVKGSRTDEAKQADSLDCFRYFCNTFLFWFIKRG